MLVRRDRDRVGQLFPTLFNHNGALDSALAVRVKAEVHPGGQPLAPPSLERAGSNAHLEMDNGGLLSGKAQTLCSEDLNWRSAKVSTLARPALMAKHLHKVLFSG
jgi:hypothetical protein